MRHENHEVSLIQFRWSFLKNKWIPKKDHVKMAKTSQPGTQTTLSKRPKWKFPSSSFKPAKKSVPENALVFIFNSYLCPLNETGKFFDLPT